MSAQDMILVIGACGALVTTIGGVAVMIIKAMREGSAVQAAAAAIAAEQQNRYLATRGAVPVTMQSPPQGTGDGRVDTAVTNQLAAAPTSPSTVPAPLPDLLNPPPGSP